MCDVVWLRGYVDFGTSCRGNVWYVSGQSAGTKPTVRTLGGIRSLLKFQWMFCWRHVTNNCSGLMYK
jgi:hypothetical protein